jgi:hypothetical protein
LDSEDAGDTFLGNVDGLHGVLSQKIELFVQSSFFFGKRFAARGPTLKLENIPLSTIHES